MANKVEQTLTRKAGPLPVWAWAALGLGVAWFLFLRNAATKAAGGTQLPYTPPAGGGSGAQQPASGQGTPADNANGDLLAALDQNTSSYNALLAALQYGGGFGGYGDYNPGSAGGSGGAAGGVPTPTVTASPTSDSGVNNAPVDAYTAAVQSAQSGSPDYSLIAAEIPLSGADQGYALENAALGNPNTDWNALGAALGIPTMQDISAQLQAYGDAIPNPTSTPVTAPTPTVVQPAPVDTGGVITPTPRPAHGLAEAA